MTQRSRFLRSALAATGTALALTSAMPTSQSAPAGTAWRLLESEYGLPGIDQGLASLETPIEPESRVRRMAEAVTDRPAVREPFLRGSVIVKFKDGAGTAKVGAMREVGGEGMAQPAHADFEVMAIPRDADPEAVAETLAERPDVEYAQARYFNHAMARPTDPLYPLQWNFPLIDMERAWDIQPGATSNITVAVIDSGVAYRNGAFQYNARAVRFEAGGPVYPALGLVTVPFAVAPDLGDASRFVAPRDFIWNDNAPVDLDGHGTHVAGTIGQSTNNGAGVAGMAFNVRIMPVKVIAGEWDFVFSNDNGGTDDIVAQGIRYAADSGAHIINMSIGREAGGASPAVEAAVRYAVSRGAFVAIAAGNDGNGQNRPNRSAEFAASVDGAVAVAAIGRGRGRAYYSTTGAYVEIAAPGGDQRADGLEGGILQQSVDGALADTYLLPPALFRAPRFDAFQYRFFQGTSMATPHVAGFAALLRQQGITSPAAIEAAMKQFATDLGASGKDNSFGVGLINPRATLRGLGLAK